MNISNEACFCLIQADWSNVIIVLQISSVMEYPVIEHSGRLSRENQLYFIVSYTSKRDPSKVSYISICHPRTSQILRTITTKEEVRIQWMFCGYIQYILVVIGLESEWWSVLCYRWRA